jgi:tetratricopeptide (TPR) repeat protein
MRYDYTEAGGVYDRVRMVARRPGVFGYWFGKIHECLIEEAPLLNTDIMVLHRKEIPPPPERNCDIIRSLPEESLRHNFWLCAECYLDMLAAGHEEEAERYAEICDEIYADDAQLCWSIVYVFAHRNLWQGVLRMTRVVLDLPERAASCDRAILVALAQKAVKGCVKLGQYREAAAYNEKVLELQPDNRAALLNRILLPKTPV